jgi:hypothetical protein
VVVLSSKWLYLLAICVPLYVTVDVMCLTLADEFSYMLVIDAMLVGIMSILLTYYIRNTLLGSFMKQLEVEQ